MNRRDLELLSAYLDGELKPADSARLEARLNTDPELVSALNDLRATRALLRKLPSRKAPRNFTLTRKMVGLNPPLPRAYPLFRLATVAATLLFFFSFGVNFVSTQLASPSAFGMGGGGAEVQSYAAEPAPEAAAPAGEEPPLALAVPQATEDAARVMETPAAKQGNGEAPPAQEQPPVAVEPLPEPQSPAPLIPSAWQIGLAAAAAAGALLLGVMRQLAARRWK